MTEQAGRNYYDVEDVEAASAQVTKAGGQVVMPKMAVPKMGWMAEVLDPEGNGFGLWLTDANAM